MVKGLREKQENTISRVYFMRTSYPQEFFNVFLPWLSSVSDSSVSVYPTSAMSTVTADVIRLIGPAANSAAHSNNTHHSLDLMR